MTERLPSLTSIPRATCQEIATALEILSLTTELFALELRTRTTTARQVQRRCRAMQRATRRMIVVARRVRVQPEHQGGDHASTLADGEVVKTIGAVVGFAAFNGQKPSVEREVLAEYVDAVHDRATSLLVRFDGSPATGRRNAP